MSSPHRRKRANGVHLWWMDSGGRFSRGGENDSRPESQSSRTHCRAISVHRAFGRRTQRRRFPLRTDCRFSRCLLDRSTSQFCSCGDSVSAEAIRLRSARITCALHGGIDIIQPQVHPSCRPAGSKHRSEHRLDQDQSRTHPPAPLRCSTLAQSVRAPTLIAGTAKAHDLALATRNVTDFDGLDVDVTNPWEEGRYGIMRRTTDTATRGPHP